MAEGDLGTYTKEDILKLKPGDYVTVAGTENWNSAAEFIREKPRKIRYIDPRSGNVNLEDSDWTSYQNTSFYPGWLSPGTGPLEGQCPKCGRWNLHSLSCPEMGLV